MADRTVHALFDPMVTQRMYGVLRLKAGERIQLFNTHVVITVTLHSITAKEVRYTVDSIEQLQPLQPAITVLLPLLKRDALYDALYTCVEMGVNTIELVITEKIHKPWYTEREAERCRAIMIAAAEQSKQFMLPRVHGPQPLASTVDNYAAVTTAYRVLFDPAGLPLLDHVHNMMSQQSEQLILAVGPEGDFTHQEKTLLNAAGFRKCALTPTVLRAQQALTVGLGAVRSCVNQ